MGKGGGKIRSLSAFVVLALIVYAADPIPAAHAGESVLGEPTGDILLEVVGEIEHTNRGEKAVFDRALLEELPPATLETTTVVTDGIQRFDGFYMRDLLELVGANGETVTASAINDYVIDIPAEDFTRFDVVVATHMNGERLEPRDKGPLWIVYPRDDHAELRDLRYDYRWVWQLNRLEIR